MVGRDDRRRVIRAVMGGDDAVDTCTYALLKVRLEGHGFSMPSLPTTMGTPHFSRLLDWTDEYWRKYVVEPVTAQHDATAEEALQRIGDTCR
jgi:hypothetical protein